MMFGRQAIPLRKRIALVLVPAVVLAGCGNPVLPESVARSRKERCAIGLKSMIAGTSLRSFGIHAKDGGREFPIDLPEAALVGLDSVVNDTDTVLEAIESDTDGDKQLVVLDAILGGATVGEVRDAMEDLDPALAEGFMTGLEGAMGTCGEAEGKAGRRTELDRMRLVDFTAGTRAAHAVNWAQDTVD